MKKSWVLIIILSLVFLLPLLAMFLPGYLGARLVAPEAELKYNLHEIQNALRAYSIKHKGNYPADISILVNDKYINDWPQNPILKHTQKMHPVGFGDPESQGNFTYLPVKINDVIIGYYLFAYGFEKKINNDIDINKDGKPENVIIILSGPKNSKLPPIKEMLKSLHGDASPGAVTAS